MRGLAEHIERITPSALGAGAFERLANGAAHHELAGEDAHGPVECLANQGLARAGHQSGHELADIAHGLGVEADDAAGEHQSPGRGVDEYRIAASEMRLPSGGGKLVADQTVRGLGIGNAQKRLGETHQNDALGARQTILVEEGVEAAGALPRLADLDDQGARQLRGGALLGGPKSTLAQRRLDHRGLVGEAQRGDAGAKRVARRRVRGENHRRGRAVT